MRTIQIYLSDLKELLAARDFTSVRAMLRTISPMDLADGWEHFTLEERKVLFKLSPRQRALQLFEELDPPEQAELLHALKGDELEHLMEDLDPAETGRMLRGLPSSMVRQLEAILEKVHRDEKVDSYLKFPDESVGALMRSNFVSLREDWSCKRAIEHIHNAVKLRHIEMMYMDQLFVVDADHMLKGIVTLKQLIVAPATVQLRELMDTDPEVLDPDMDQEVAARIFAHYKLPSAPVVDRAHRLLGVVLDQDIVEVVEEETEEDFAKMAGTRAEEFESRSAWDAAWHRMPWLGVTFAGQFLVSAVIRGFEQTLSSVVALATFMPLIAAMGGNVGSQSAIIVVRALAAGELQGQERRAVLRDLGVGLLVGLVYAAVISLASHALYGARFGWRFSAVVGLGTLLSMAVASTLGSMVPFVFRRVGVDPATATGPLVTTLTDLISTASYLSLAAYLLFA